MKKLLTLIAVFISALAGAQTITFYTPEIVRIEKGGPRTAQSLSVVLAPQDVKVSMSHKGGADVYTSSALKVSVDRASGKVTFATKGGKKLVSEAASVLDPITEGVDKGAWKAGQGWTLDGDEPIYGIGMMQDGKMNVRGENRRMIQTNLEDFANFFQSIKGYGIFWDNYSPTDISDDGAVLSLTSDVAEEIDYYFIYGGNADGVIKGLRTLTGHVPMVPLWTYGFHQSRERYKSQDELLEVVRGYRKAGIPLDGIIQDWQYWGSNYLWNAMDFLNETFPNPKAMIDETHALNAHMSISIWQSFGPMTIPYRQLDEKGLLLSFSTWPTSGSSLWPPKRQYPSGVRCYDAYSSEARDIYWDNLRRLWDLDIDAWWMDSTDPDFNYVEGDFDEMTGMGSLRSVRNAYPLMCVKAVADHQRAASNDKRVYIFTRSYFTGQQRTGAHVWSGDTQSTWEAYRAQIPLSLNCTLTGYPNVNSDIGGFFPSGYNKPGQTATCSQNPRFQELYVRWIQFGVFTPMMRSHGESSRREIWEFGEPGEPVYDAIAEAIRLRYAILPYTYSTAWQVTSNDDSFMRALVMDFAGDSRVRDMGDEYLYGRSLLVAPVTSAMYTSEERRWSEETPDWTASKADDVYLPAGAGWYDWYTGAHYAGGQDVSVDASLSHCPVFAREGAIIPLGPEVQYASQKPWDDMEVRVYLGSDGSFTLYEDEGDGYAYEDGAYSTIAFTLKGSTLTIGERKGSFPGMLQSRRFRVRFFSPDGSVTERDIEYNGTKMTIR